MATLLVESAKSEEKNWKKKQINISYVLSFVAEKTKKKTTGGKKRKRNTNASSGTDADLEDM